MAVRRGPTSSIGVGLATPARLRACQCASLSEDSRPQSSRWMHKRFLLPAQNGLTAGLNFFVRGPLCPTANPNQPLRDIDRAQITLR